MILFKMQFLVNTIEKVKLQYIHFYNFILDLYFMHLLKRKTIKKMFFKKMS